MIVILTLSNAKGKNLLLHLPAFAATAGECKGSFARAQDDEHFLQLKS
jgi:hypothetical protein